MAHRFTLGVEEEFQIVDPQTWELRSHVSELLASSGPSLGDQIKRELHQSIVEVGTKICENVAELEEEIFRIRHELTTGAERVGLCVAAAGTHPFSHWKDQILTPASATTPSSKSSSSSRGRCSSSACTSTWRCRIARRRST
jgi:glutamate---cysteine ligase / carboxylate-amine ligase